MNKYIPSFETDISVYTKKHILDPYKDALNKINSLIEITNFNSTAEITVNKEFLEEVERLLELVVNRRV